MNDYIDRQAAIKAVSSMFAPTPTQKDMVEDCLGIIENLPSAEVEPVKRGKWLTEVYEYGNDEEEDRWVVCPAQDGDSAYCSLCGKSALLDGGEEYVLSPYCPHCGAKMDNT